MKLNDYFDEVEMSDIKKGDVFCVGFIQDGKLTPPADTEMEGGVCMSDLFIATKDYDDLSDKARKKMTEHPSFIGLWKYTGV